MVAILTAAAEGARTWDFVSGGGAEKRSVLVGDETEVGSRGGSEVAAPCGTAVGAEAEARSRCDADEEAEARARRDGACDPTHKIEN